MAVGRIGARQGERGVVVVVALLVMIALAGVALVGAQRVSNEIDRSGNFRVAKDGAAMTQSAFAAGLAMLQNQGSQLLDAMRTRGMTNLDLDAASFEAIELFDFDEGGSFGQALAAGDTDFLNRLSILGQANVPGYSVGEYTYYRVAMTTWGNFGDDTATGMEQLQSAQRQIRAILLVGPMAQPQMVQ